MYYLIDKDKRFVFKSPNYAETEFYYIMIVKEDNKAAFMKDVHDIVKSDTDFDATQTDVWDGVNFVDAAKVNFDLENYN